LGKAYTYLRLDMGDTKLPTTESLNFENIPHEYTGPPDVGINFIEEDSKSLLGDRIGPNEAAQSAWSLDYYKVFFNVGTKDVASRLVRSLLPFRSNFYARGEVPDLYGPFWIVTTLVVILAITGNFAGYIHFLPTQQTIQWRYDFEKVTLAASVFYTMISVIPLIVYLGMRRVGVSGNHLWITHVISLYGYSFFSYVPAAVLCVTPIDTVRWVAIALCFCLSSFFLVRNIRSYFPVDQLDWDAQAKFKGTVLLGVVTLGHLAVALITKFYFFEYPDPVV